MVRCRRQCSLARNSANSVRRRPRLPRRASAAYNSKEGLAEVPETMHNVIPIQQKASR
jgi:hypothetical protein